MRRGDVVLVYVPFVGAQGGKTRPAVIVQNDSLNSLLRETESVWRRGHSTSDTIHYAAESVGRRLTDRRPRRGTRNRMVGASAKASSTRRR